MSFTPSLAVAANADVVTASSITSGAFDVTKGDLIIAYGGCRTGTLAAPFVSTTCTGAVPKLEANPQSGSDTAEICGWFYAEATETGRTVTANFGVSGTRHTLTVLKMDGAHRGLPVRQVKPGNQASGNSMTVTFDANPLASSQVIGAITNRAATNITADTGTELSEVGTGSGTTHIRQNVQYLTGTTNPAVSWSSLGNNTAAAILIEVAVAEALTPMVTRVVSPPIGKKETVPTIVSQLVQPTTVGGILMVHAGCRFGTTPTEITPSISTSELEVGSWATFLLANIGQREWNIFSWAPITGVTSGILTVDFTASPDQGHLLIITEIIGQDETNPIAQYKQYGAVTPPVPLIVTMDAVPAGDSEVIGCITNYKGGTGTDIVPVGQELAEVNSSLGTVAALELQRQTTLDQDVEWTTLNPSRSAALAIEIAKEAGIPGGQPSGQKVIWI